MLGWLVIAVPFASVAYAAGNGGCDIVTDCLDDGVLTSIMRIFLTLSLILTHPVFFIVISRYFETQFLLSNDQSKDSMSSSFSSLSSGGEGEYENETKKITQSSVDSYSSESSLSISGDGPNGYLSPLLDEYLNENINGDHHHTIDNIDNNDNIEKSNSTLDNTTFYNQTQDSNNIQNIISSPLINTSSNSDDNDDEDNDDDEDEIFSFCKTYQFFFFEKQNHNSLLSTFFLITLNHFNIYDKM